MSPPGRGARASAGRERGLEARPAAIERARRGVGSQVGARRRRAPTRAPRSRACAGAATARAHREQLDALVGGRLDRQAREVRVAAHDEPAVLAPKLLDRRAQRQLGVGLAEPVDRARDARARGHRGTDSRRTSAPSGGGARSAALRSCSNLRTSTSSSVRSRSTRCHLSRSMAGRSANSDRRASASRVRDTLHEAGAVRGVGVGQEVQMQPQVVAHQPLVVASPQAAGACSARKARTCSTAASRSRSARICSRFCVIEAPSARIRYW